LDIDDIAIWHFTYEGCWKQKSSLDTWKNMLIKFGVLFETPTFKFAFIDDVDLLPYSRYVQSFDCLGRDCTSVVADAAAADS
jgi:hypothetical protein